MGAIGSCLQVHDGCCLSWLRMLAGTRARLDGFCWSACSCPARYRNAGVKLPLGYTVLFQNYAPLKNTLQNSCRESQI